jgi:hypothetical protein
MAGRGNIPWRGTDNLLIQIGVVWFKNEGTTAGGLVQQSLCTAAFGLGLRQIYHFVVDFA